MKKQVLFVLTFTLAGQWGGVLDGMNLNPENLKGLGEVETQEHVKAENLEECPICCNQVDNPVALLCVTDHFFCFECLSNLEKTTAPNVNVPCPTCRKKYTHETVQLLLEIKTNALSQEDLFDALKNAILAHKVNTDNVKMVVLILDKGLSVNFKHRITGMTPLILAIEFANKKDNTLQLLKKLLERGARIEEPLQANFFSGRIQKFEKKAALILLEHFKASHVQDADVVKSFLNTSLAQAQYIQTIDVLIECGADKDFLSADKMAAIYKESNKRIKVYGDLSHSSSWPRATPLYVPVTIYPPVQEIERYVQQYYPDFRYAE